MDTIKPDWIKRGYCSSEDLSKYKQFSDSDLVKLLKSKIPVERTIAASLLGERKFEKAVIPLCDSLKKENALYSKIAISEALGNIGEKAVGQLISLLGKIGKNQYKSLPDKPFEKWNYPLPRDIAARTLVRIREAALESLLKSITSMKRQQLSEAIDTVGFISYYCKNTSAYGTVINLLQKFKNDNLIVWKIVTCLQSFPCTETEEILGQYLTSHSQPAIRWEAARSMGQICIKVPKALLLSINDNNAHVREMSKNSQFRIIQKLNQ